jgi:hypothetical protein
LIPKPLALNLDPQTFGPKPWTSDPQTFGPKTLDLGSQTTFIESAMCIGRLQVRGGLRVDEGTVRSVPLCQG